MNSWAPASAKTLGTAGRAAFCREPRGKQSYLGQLLHQDRHGVQRPSRRPEAIQALISIEDYAVFSGGSRNYLTPESSISGSPDATFPSFLVVPAEALVWAACVWDPRQVVVLLIEDPCGHAPLDHPGLLRHDAGHKIRSPIRFPRGLAQRGKGRRHRNPWQNLPKPPSEVDSIQADRISGLAGVHFTQSLKTSENGTVEKAAANYCGLSVQGPSTVSQTAGKPVFANWSRKARVDAAAQFCWRQATATVGEISQAVGYGSSASFSRAFQQSYGRFAGRLQKQQARGSPTNN